MDTGKKKYEDYKYVLQDAGSLSIGAKYSYEELLHDEDIPFKFKVIAERYLGTGLDPQTTLESQLYYLTADGFVYECFVQLRTKLKISVLKEKKNFWGKVKSGYVTEVVPIKEFVQQDEAWKKEHGVMIQEIVMSKLSLMTFSV